MRRRTMLKWLGGLGLTAAAPALRATAADDPSDKPRPGEHLLDWLRDRIHAWTESLWDSRSGGFRETDEIGPALMMTTDVAWMRYATHDADIAGGHRDAWIGYLQRSQDSKTGLVRYTIGTKHSDGHALWQTVRALNILGGQLLHFPEYLRPLLTVDGLRAWFDRVDWDSPAGNHHEVLGLVPLLANLNNAEWTEAFYQRIGQQQNPQTGGFPKSKVNISRTFAYTALYRATGRLPPHPERIVDTMLSLQRDEAFWDKEPGFLTMDAAYVLLRLPPLVDHRRDDARRALSRLADVLPGYYLRHEPTTRRTPHKIQANVHTFSLLQEAFPDRFPSQRPYRWDWDKPSMYRCDVVAARPSR